MEMTAELLQQTAQRASLGGHLRTRTTAGPLDILWRLHHGRGYDDFVDPASTPVARMVHLYGARHVQVDAQQTARLYCSVSIAVAW